MAVSGNTNPKIFKESQTLNATFNGKVFSIPSPIETALLLKNKGGDFDATILNKTENHHASVHAIAPMFLVWEFHRKLYFLLHSTSVGNIDVYNLSCYNWRERSLLPSLPLPIPHNPKIIFA